MADPPDRRRKHGRYASRLYRIWVEMKASCRRPSHRSYRLTGDKGISYAADWETFAGFARWAGASGYQPDLTLARKHRNQDFSPANCHWKPFQPRGPKARLARALPPRRTEVEEPSPQRPDEPWEIDKDVPLQPNIAGERRGRRKRRWPFRRMEPLDSFLIRTPRPELEIRLAYAAARRLGIRIATRRDAQGVRIWKLP